MKKITLIALIALLTGCVNSNIDLNNKNTYGLKCSTGPNSQANWEGCMINAKRLCEGLNVTNVVQHNPVGSGSANDGYFMTFTCSASAAPQQSNIKQQSNTPQTIQVR